ncbi:MAG TPA: hypothetical protein VF636_04465 [Sphingomonas sp.]|jgi:hypothetical protein
MKMAARFHQPAPLPLDALLATIPSLPRPVLSRLVARMIDHIDGLDPDPEEEDDDPAGDPLDRGELDESRPDGIKLPRPVYGADQSLGPVNYAETCRAWQEALRAH